MTKPSLSTSVHALVSLIHDLTAYIQSLPYSTQGAQLKRARELQQLTDKALAKQTDDAILQLLQVTIIPKLERLANEVYHSQSLMRSLPLGKTHARKRRRSTTLNPPAYEPYIGVATKNHYTDLPKSEQQRIEAIIKQLQQGCERTTE